MSKKIKTYAELHEFAQEIGMMYGKEFPENVVIRVEVEFYEYRQILEDVHRTMYQSSVRPSEIRIYESHGKTPSFTILFGPIKFLVSMNEPTYNFNT